MSIVGDYNHKAYCTFDFCKYGQGVLCPQWRGNRPESKPQESNEHGFTNAFGKGFVPAINYFRDLKSAYDNAIKSRDLWKARSDKNGARWQFEQNAKQIGALKLEVEHKNKRLIETNGYLHDANEEIRELKAEIHKWQDFYKNNDQANEIATLKADNEHQERRADSAELKLDKLNDFYKAQSMKQDARIAEFEQRVGYKLVIDTNMPDDKMLIIEPDGKKTVIDLEAPGDK